MSPRAAWRLETLGFEHVYEYVTGKADWLAHGLPREGENADVPYAGELLDREPPTCALNDDVPAMTAAVASARYGFCLVVSEERIVLGRVRKSALEHAASDATAEQLMEPGPSTVRPNTPAQTLLERLAKQGLHTAIVTTPEGRLLGVFARELAEREVMTTDPER